jgi:hypothetical protein
MPTERRRESSGYLATVAEIAIQVAEELPRLLLNHLSCRGVEEIAGISFSPPTFLEPLFALACQRMRSDALRLWIRR